MAVRAGQLLDTVISRTKAKLYVCIGWIYSLIIALLRSYMDNFDYTGSSLSTKFAHGRITWAFSTLILIFLVILVQASTYFKIRKRISMAVGALNATQGINNLYKRALKKSTLVAVCFAIGWSPLFIFFLVQDLRHASYGKTERLLSLLFTSLALLQCCSNAIIFRAKHLLSNIKQCFTC